MKMRNKIPSWSVLLQLTTTKSSSWVLAMVIFPPLIKALEGFKYIAVIDAFVFKLQSYYIAFAYISISFWLIKLCCPKEVKEQLSKGQEFDHYAYSLKEKEKIFNYLQVKGYFEKEAIDQVPDSEIALLNFTEKDSSLLFVRALISSIMLIGLSILIIYFLINVVNISNNWIESINFSIA